LNKLAPADY